MKADQLAEALIDWFKKTERNLPWRLSYDPYQVWISEIMLQQTQMDRGVAYFNRWIGRFPDVSSVATCSEQEILKYWEGLGYYARARNLHKAAQIMVTDFGGKVPCDYATLLSLPGIGPYTAAAVSSIAGNFDIPVIDANVCRVYSRLLNIDTPIKSVQAQKQIQGYAARVLPHGRARKYNQAVMDLGGLICTPKKPKCSLCPIRTECKAHKVGTVAERPVTGRKSRTVRLQKISALIVKDKKIFIQQRGSDQVWGGLWEFPGGEIKESLVDLPVDEMVSEIVFNDCGLSVKMMRHLVKVQHQYTHHKISLLSYLCRPTDNKQAPILKDSTHFKWVGCNELKEYAFPAGPRKVVDFLAQNDLFALLDLC